MNSKKLCVLAVALLVASGCGSKAGSKDGAGAGSGDLAGSTAGSSGAGSAAGSGSQSGAGTASTLGPGMIAELPDGGMTFVIDPDAATPTVDDPCDYEMEDVQVTTDLVIAAGETVHVCAGTKFTAAKDVKIQVLGNLVVDGTAEAPVSFLGTAAAVRSWHGIVVGSGGSLKLSFANVGGAIYGIFTEAGSTFVIDRSHFDTSFKNAVLQSEGTVTNSTFQASAPPTIAITEAVNIDDPNGTVTIIDASPSFSNCKFDGASAFTDLVRVGGASSSTFDHVSMASAHCGFHTSGGTNTSIHVTNSIIEKMSYGIMAYTTKPIIEDSIMRMNGNDVGLCNGATKDNTPVLKNNNYTTGMPRVDASCFMIDTTDPSPAATANPLAGSSGL